MAPKWPRCREVTLSKLNGHQESEPLSSQRNFQFSNLVPNHAQEKKISAPSLPHFLTRFTSTDFFVVQNKKKDFRLVFCSSPETRRPRFGFLKLFFSPFLSFFYRKRVRSNTFAYLIMPYKHLLPLPPKPNPFDRDLRGELNFKVNGLKNIQSIFETMCPTLKILFLPHAYYHRRQI